MPDIELPSQITCHWQTDIGDMIFQCQELYDYQNLLVICSASWLNSILVHLGICSLQPTKNLAQSILLFPSLKPYLPNSIQWSLMFYKEPIMWLAPNLNPRTKFPSTHFFLHRLQSFRPRPSPVSSRPWTQQLYWTKDYLFLAAPTGTLKVSKTLFCSLVGSSKTGIGQEFKFLFLFFIDWLVDNTLQEVQ